MMLLLSSVPLTASCFLSPVIDGRRSADLSKRLAHAEASEQLRCVQIAFRPAAHEAPACRRAAQLVDVVAGVDELVPGPLRGPEAADEPGALGSGIAIDFDDRISGDVDGLARGGGRARGEFLAAAVYPVADHVEVTVLGEQIRVSLTVSAVG